MTYYIDPEKGSNQNDGLSAAQPYADLTPLCGAPVPAGTDILLKAGTRMEGCFVLEAAGEEGQPVRITAYGEGEKPILDGVGAQCALNVHNSRYVEVSHLEFHNTAAEPDYCSGLVVSTGGADHPGGVMPHTVLRDLTVRKVNSILCRDAAGLYITNRESANPCRYDDFLIENCDISDTGTCGIIFSSCYGHRPEVPHWDIQPLPFYPATHVVIRHNRVYDLPGDGMWISTTKNALLEYNTVYNTSYGTYTAYAGMWPHNSDGCVMQYNEVYNNRLAAGDGQGMDVDINCNDTIVQYNYSHDNEGGFLLVCTDGEEGNYNRGTVVRYNISYNDQDSLMTIKGIEVTGLKVYNNTFYTDKGYPNGTISTLLWRDNDATFTNNIFVDQSSVTSRFVDAKDGDGKSRDNGLIHMAFQSNCFCGKAPEAEETVAVDADNRSVENPGMVNPQGGHTEGFRLTADSVCRSGGRKVPGDCHKDFTGKTEEIDKQFIGACAGQ